MDNQLKPLGGYSDDKFKTPQQVAALDSHSTASPLLKIINASKNKPKKHRFWPLSRKAWIIVGVVVIVIAAGIFSYLKFFHTSHLTSNVFTTKSKTRAISDSVASSLTGLPVSPATNKLPITAVMIENDIAARPQSGLGEAGVVFEAWAEGGITRFVALYQSDSPTSLGPVRSARPYFISWMMGFDAAYAHVGGSPEGLSDISSWGVKDMDQFYNSSYYERVSSKPAPHNVYTTMSLLYKLEQAKGYTTSTFTSWPRKKAEALKKPSATSISLNYGSTDYDVNYSYDSSTNSYERDVGGSPQIDADSNQQISVPVVIAIVVQESNGPLDSSDAYYSEYQTIGSGTAYVFQDGGVTVGQWSKSANSAQIEFSKSDGQPIALDPGEVWISAMTASSEVSYH